MAGRVIRPEGAPQHRLPFSPGVLAGQTLYVSGMVAVDAAGEIVAPGDVGAQTRFVLESVRAVVEAAGGSMADVVFNQVFLKDLSDFRAMNRAYRDFFPEDPPARYCVQSPLVLGELLVEIASIAHLETSSESKPTRE